MNKRGLTTTAIVIISLIVLGAIFGILISTSNKSLSVVGENDVLKYAIPHMASYKCEPVEDKFGISISIPESGALLSKETVGFNTNGITNVKTSVGYSFWTSLIKDLRLRYATCDANGNNCGDFTVVKYPFAGQKFAVINSVDFETQSLNVYFEQQTLLNYPIGRWTPYSGATISFDGTAFGLTLSSTTQDPAGAVICSTSCNLNCPDIGYREKLLLTGETTLDFYDTAPYLEYWESIDYDLNSQAGATIFNSAKNEFCFAGAIYSSGELKMDNGVTYIYPQTYKRTVQCCPGAVISSSYSDQVCQSDGTWKTIENSNQLTCISDFNCPGAGLPTCQKRVLAGYTCVNKDENGVGLCSIQSGTIVECCVNGDCAIDQVCDTSTHSCKGGTTLPVCGDGKLDAGEQCDDGNTISGDGCTTTCETEVEYCLTHPEDPVCNGNKCSSCDAFANSKLFGWLSQDDSSELNCKAKTILGIKTQNAFTCLGSFAKLFGVILIILLFPFIFSKLVLDRLKILQGNSIVKGLLSLIISVVFAYIFYLLFWVGLVVMAIILVIGRVVPLPRR